MIWRSSRRIAGLMWPSLAVAAVAVSLAVTDAPLMAQAHGDSVWVNTRSGVYHCPGSHSYGTSKHGQYMPEATAVSRSFKPAKGRSCSARAARHAAPTAGHEGEVWVDTASHVYLCPGASGYGTGNAGAYMTEQAALAAGNRSAKGRRCQ